jgi:hypothetical protein
MTDETTKKDDFPFTPPTNHAEVLARLTPTAAQAGKIQLPISDEEKAAAFELIKNSALKDYLVPNTAEAAKARMNAAALNPAMDAETRSLLEAHAAKLPDGKSKLGEFADCPPNDMMIESVARIQKYAKSNLALKLVEEETALLRMVLTRVMPSYNFASHDVRLDVAPKGLTVEQHDGYREAQYAVTAFVSDIQKSCKSAVAATGK